MSFDKVRAVRDEKGRRQLVSTGEPEQVFECDDVLVAVGQENAFPWIERDAGIAFDEWGMPVLDPTTLQSSLPRVFFGGDARARPEEHHLGGRARATPRRSRSTSSCTARTSSSAPPPASPSSRRRWASTSGATTTTSRPTCATRCRGATSTSRCATSRSRSSSAFDVATAWKEAQRCLNCDVQTVFTTSQCIECDACVDICPTDCITFTANGEEADLRTRLHAPARHADQALYVSDTLKTGRVMVKDEDVCLHCGLCAERCPTGAWDMQKFIDHADARAAAAAASAKRPKKVATR